MSLPVSKLVVRTSWGAIRIEMQDGAVTRCDLPRVGDDPAKPLVVQSSSARLAREKDGPAMLRAECFIRDALRGASARRPRIIEPAGTVFQRAVWRNLCRVKKGVPVSYGQLARMIGKPRAARAVGSACAQNPLPLFIPCHRVLAAGGRLGGFSGGLGWKKWLLEQEHTACV